MSKDNRKKIFVLDSSAISHDHNTIDNIHEHDVAIPISVLEELDTFKKGNGTINFMKAFRKLNKIKSLSIVFPLFNESKRLKTSIKHE